MNWIKWRRCGLAKPPMRSSVALENGRRSSCACIAWYSDIHAVTSMLIGRLQMLSEPLRPGAGLQSPMVERRNDR
jgi:hypothetical protein